MNTRQKNLIDQYNQPGNLLVVTNYPPRGEGVHTAAIGGVAGFAKNTLLPLSRHYNKEDKQIIVLAEILDKAGAYEEDGMLIVRCWNRNSVILYWQLAKQCLTFSRVNDVLIEFEFASYGDFFTTSVFPIFLFFLRLMGKRISLVLHQVVTDLWSLTGHIGLTDQNFIFNMFSVLLPLFYGFLTHLASCTIVLERMFRKRLRGLAPMDRVSVIPHGVETQKNLTSKATSRKHLGLANKDFVVLSFGFITWYKGTDLLVQALRNTKTIAGKRLRLMIAGGPSTSQKHKRHYQTFYERVMHLIGKSNHITVTGFVPQTELADYFAACDVVVFPYRTVMSSSGPLSLALSYHKPIVLSRSMKDYFYTSDVQLAMNKTKVSKSLLFMPQDWSKLPSQLEKVSIAANQNRLKHFSMVIAQKRSFTSIAADYYTILTKPNSAHTLSLRPAFA